MGTSQSYTALSILGLMSALIAIGCSAPVEEEEASSSTSELSAGSTLREFDRDIVIPDQSLTLSRAFSETLTRYGVTIKPTITPSGSFTLTGADVHLQAQYTSRYPYVNRIDVSARGDWTATARLDVDVTAGADWTRSADFRKSFTAGTSLGGKAFELARVPLAVIPLPAAPMIQVQLDLELAATCELDFDAELHAFAEVGVGGTASADVFYDRALSNRVGFVGNGGLTAADVFHVTTPPHVGFKDGNQAQVHGRCSIQPSINATVSLGADPEHPVADVGVKFVVEPYAQIDGVFRSMQDWSIDAKLGVESSVSPFGDFVGHRIQRGSDLELFDVELAREHFSSADR